MDQQSLAWILTPDQQVAFLQISEAHVKSGTIYFSKYYTKLNILFPRLIFKDFRISQLVPILDSIKM